MLTSRRPFRLKIALAFIAPLLVSQFAVAQVCDAVFRPTSSVMFEGDHGRVTVSRAKACLPSGECFVLLNKPSNRPAMRDSTLRSLLGRSGSIVSHHTSNNPAVNCHGFSCSVTGIPSLPNNVWIDPQDLIVILQDYFSPTNQRFQDGEFLNFATNPFIQENDMVVMANFQRSINHTGLVRKVQVNGRIENWVLSKLDEGVVILAPLENVTGHYQISYVSVYRYNGRLR